jgi:hypothetical protein
MQVWMQWTVSVECGRKNVSMMEQFECAQWLLECVVCECECVAMMCALLSVTVPYLGNARKNAPVTIKI